MHGVCGANVEAPFNHETKPVRTFSCQNYYLYLSESRARRKKIDFSIQVADSRPTGVARTISQGNPQTRLNLERDSCTSRKPSEDKMT